MNDFYLHAPGDIVDYQLYWGDELESGETISTSTWVVPTGLTSASPTIAGDYTKIRLSTGTAGTRYQVKNTIVKNTGVTLAKSLFIYCEVK